ncbi:hypothetical protein WJX74_006088 [Apatococcus lobatus]|uniref:Uncharacterized protein n=1 Tax=Apatococcus lobatus TaxID=904363 RepID=A0AAW1S2C6_9CHLO
MCKGLRTCRFAPAGQPAGSRAGTSFLLQGVEALRQAVSGSTLRFLRVFRLGQVLRKKIADRFLGQRLSSGLHPPALNNKRAMSDSEPDLPSTPPSRSRTEPLKCPPAPRKLRPTKTWEGSRDCRAVRRLDFTAGRPPAHFDFAAAPAFSTADSHASASLPHGLSASLAEIPAPSGGLLGMSSNSLPDEFAPAMLGPSTPYASALPSSHQQQQPQAQPVALQSQPMQPFSYDSLSRPRGIRSLQPHQSHQGPSGSFPLQHGHEGVSPASRSHWQSQQHAQPSSSHMGWPSAPVPEWQTGARILPDQRPASGCAGLSPHALQFHAQPLATQACPSVHEQANSAFAFVASSPLQPASTGTGVVTAPFSSQPSVPQPEGGNAGLPTPFAFSGGHASTPFGFPTPSNQPSFPGSPALRHDSSRDLQPGIGGFSHPFGAHQPPVPSERQLFGFDRLASRGSGTGAFLPE